MEHEGRLIVLVDTPGFDDYTLSDVGALRMIASWLRIEYEGGSKLSGVLYFHDLSEGRLSGSGLRQINVFESMCGKSALKNVSLLTTRWDNGASADLKREDKELKTNFWKGMIANGAKPMRCENTKESALAIISDVLQRAETDGKEWLQLQFELEKKPLSETNAGITLTKHLEQQRIAYEAQLKRLHEDYKDALHLSGMEAQRISETEQRRVEYDIRNIQQQQQQQRYNERDGIRERALVKISRLMRLEALQLRDAPGFEPLTEQVSSEAREKCVERLAMHQRNAEAYRLRLDMVQDNLQEVYELQERIAYTKKTIDRLKSVLHPQERKATVLEDQTRRHLSLVLQSVNRWIELMSRPRLKKGYRRIEWTCVSVDSSEDKYN